MKNETLVTEVAHRQEREEGRDDGQTSKGNRGVTRNEEDDRKEKKISETLPKAKRMRGRKSSKWNRRQAKLEDNTTSHKIGESGIRGDEKEGENEKDDRKEKEISETLLKAEGEGTEGQQAELEAGKIRR